MWCVIISCFGLLVTSPSSLTRHVHTPIFNYLIGKQLDVGITNITGPLVLKTYSHDCDVNVKGAIVLLWNQLKETRSQQEEHDLALCAQKGGALAVIRMLEDYGVVGFEYNYNQGVKNEVTIPMLSVLKRSLADVSTSIGENTTVIGRVDVTKNPWLDMWDSTAFWLIFQVFLSLFNIFGAFVALRGLWAHIRRWRTNVRPRRSSVTARSKFVIPTSNWMVLGCAIEFIACCLRCGYLIAGPMLSTHQIKYIAHFFLMNITIPLGICTTAISTILFLRWGALGRKRSEVYIELVLLLVAIATVAFQLVLSYIQGSVAGADVVLLVTINAFIVIAIDIISTVVFLWFGHSFVSTLEILSDFAGNDKTINAVRQRQIKKAVRWIMVSAFAHVLMIVVVATAGASVRLFLSPNGFLILYALLYLSLTGASLAQSFAFQPLLGKGAQVMVVNFNFYDGE
eukprot:c4090_g1_i2.p1 GENE.c4090_g1_i2~~c4090_g1_i2.p1  ORF type:complete len:455 (+),score=84.22 c4090_g1_i2:43-1407(+)